MTGQLHPLVLLIAWSPERGEGGLDGEACLASPVYIESGGGGRRVRRMVTVRTLIPWPSDDPARPCPLLRPSPHLPHPSPSPLPQARTAAGELAERRAHLSSTAPAHGAELARASEAAAAAVAAAEAAEAAHVARVSESTTAMQTVHARRTAAQQVGGGKVPLSPPVCCRGCHACLPTHGQHLEHVHAPHGGAAC